MIELDKILTPIREDAPAGVDLRDQPGDVTLQEIEQERTAVLPEDDPNGAGHEPNWVRVAASCEEALAESSKDLQLAVWLTESLTRQHGLTGLHAGLRMVKELVERFWDAMHPGFDPDGVVLPIRARHLSWLGSSGDFIRTTASCPIVPAAGESRALSWEDYRNTELVDSKKMLADAGQYEDLKATGLIDGDEWSARFASLPPAETRQTLDNVKLCQDALNELRIVADKQLGSDDEANFVPLAELLLELREYVESHLPSEEEAGVENAGEAAPEGGPAQASGPVASRDEALRRLSQAAEYFRRAEPHSPISYLVERAVRWGHMPLMEVLQEFIEDPSSLERIQSNLGIRTNEPTDG